MSILGTLIDKTTISRAGDDLKGVTAATLAHSLPHTNPEIGLAAVRSIEELGGDGARGLPAVFVVGGNASIAMASGVSCPTISANIVLIVPHSVIR
jgi:hypothetical protein